MKSKKLNSDYKEVAVLIIVVAIFVLVPSCVILGEVGIEIIRNYAEAYQINHYQGGVAIETILRIFSNSAHMSAFGRFYPPP